MNVTRAQQALGTDKMLAIARESWWTEVNVATDGWMRQTDLGTERAQRNTEPADVIDAPAGYGTNGTEEKAPSAGTDTPAATLDIAIATHQLRQLTVELLLHLYTAFPSQVLGHLARWCAEDGTATAGDRAQLLSPLLNRLRLHPDLHAVGERKASGATENLFALLRSESAHAVRRCARSLWAGCERDLPSPSLTPSNSAQAPTASQQQHVRDVSTRSQVDTAERRETKRVRTRALQRRYSFADADDQGRGVAWGFSYVDSVADCAQLVSSSGGTAKEQDNALCALQSCVQRCLWQQRAAGGADVDGDRTTAWQPDCRVPLASMFVTTRPTAASAHNSVQKQPGTDALAVPRRRSFLHRLLSPLGSDTAVTDARRSAAKASSPASRPTEHIDIGAATLLAAAADEAAVAPDNFGRRPPATSRAETPPTAAQPTLPQMAGAAITTTSGRHGERRERLQQIFLAVEVARKEHENARLTHELYVKRKQLVQAEYRAANIATMSARMKAAQAEAANARTEARDLRRNIASIRAAQKKWATQMQLKMRKFAAGREHASETGSELHVRSVALETELGSLRKQLEVLASSEAHQRAVAAHAHLRAETATTDARTVDILLQQVAHSSELAWSRGTELHKLHNAIQEERYRPQYAGKDDRRAVTDGTIIMDDIDGTSRTLHLPKVKSSTTPIQLSDTGPLTPLRSPLRSPLSSPSPKQVSGRLTPQSSAAHFRVHTNRICSCLALL